MAVDIFLKLDKIKGESQDGTHKDEIDVLSWSWGMTQSASTHGGGGGGSGKVSVNDLTITKYVDKATPNLMKWCCRGEHISEAVLVVRKAGGAKPLEYLKIKLNEVIVSSVTSAGAATDERLVESISLNFSYFEVEYVPQKKDGSGDAAIPMTWNIKANNESKPK